MQRGGEVAMRIETAHEMFRDGDFEGALGHYTDALSMARSPQQKIALHSNRAACFLKLQRFKLAAEECTAVLQLDQQHTGALMLRAQTLVTLKEYHSALFDVSRLVELNPSSDSYRNLESRLRTQLSLAPIPESEAEFEVDDDDEEEDTQIGEDESFLKEEPRKSIAVEVIAQAKRKSPVENDDSAGIPEVPRADSSIGWQTIPKPKGHAALDYARWDRLDDDSCTDSDEEEEDEDESPPQYRFRVKSAGTVP